MSGYPNGPYHYYLDGIIAPRVCEVEGGRVWFTGDDKSVRITKLSGKLIRLVEVEQQQPSAGAKEAGA